MFPTISFLVGGGFLGWILYELNCSSGHDMFAFASRHHKKKHGGEYGGGKGSNPGNPHNKGGKHYVGTKGYYTKKGHHHCFKGSGPGCVCTDPSKCHVKHHSNLGFVPGSGGGAGAGHDHDGAGAGGGFNHIGDHAGSDHDDHLHPFGGDHDHDDHHHFGHGFEFGHRESHPFLPYGGYPYPYPEVEPVIPYPEPYPYPYPYPYPRYHPHHHRHLPRFHPGHIRRLPPVFRRRR